MREIEFEIPRALNIIDMEDVLARRITMSTQCNGRAYSETEYITLCRDESDPSVHGWYVSRSPMQPLTHVRVLNPQIAWSREYEKAKAYAEDDMAGRIKVAIMQEANR